jgi:hypothetical protein
MGINNFQHLMAKKGCRLMIGAVSFDSLTKAVDAAVSNSDLALKTTVPRFAFSHPHFFSVSME